MFIKWLLSKQLAKCQGFNQTIFVRISTQNKEIYTFALTELFRLFTFPKTTNDDGDYQFAAICW